MANLRRRSARLSKANAATTPRKTPRKQSQFKPLAERDETPEHVSQSINQVLSTPGSSRNNVDDSSALNDFRTPPAEPKPDKAEMDPKTIHRSTMKAPDSGLRLGFSEISKEKGINTPSKSAVVTDDPSTIPFEFKFRSDLHLTKDTQDLMRSIREDADKIKAQLQAEKEAQHQADQEAENMFGAGRRIARPKGRAGRFSDVHMAQFKKMDSIANHPSAQRARPGFAAPTAQSLKRSPSKAELDKREQVQASRKVACGRPRHVPPPILGRPASLSPFKPVPSVEARNAAGPSKRLRQSTHQDTSDSRPPSLLPKPSKSTLYSPTKSSLARSSGETSSLGKLSMIPRATSGKEMLPGTNSSCIIPYSPAKQNLLKPLPALPIDSQVTISSDLLLSPVKTLRSNATEHSSTSKLPTLSGLKSILRGTRKTQPNIERPLTPKRPNTSGLDNTSSKKVDFTPSVKSRHAVKLAIDSPSPAKIRRDTPFKASQTAILYDSSAYLIAADDDQDWEDESIDIAYPTLPSVCEPVSTADNFVAKAKEHSKRESKEFKSIFTDLRPNRTKVPATLTSVNTLVNKTNPEAHANKVVRSPRNSSMSQSPATIRQVHATQDTELPDPFDGKIKAIPHGLQGKRRRYESLKKDDDNDLDEGGKENRYVFEKLLVPGGWDDSRENTQEEVERSGKRARTDNFKETVVERSATKKPSAAREAAARNAKDRKSRDVLSLSRLNMLSRPKLRD